jgi:hypothetical protein
MFKRVLVSFMLIAGGVANAQAAEDEKLHKVAAVQQAQIAQLQQELDALKQFVGSVIADPSRATWEGRTVSLVGPKGDQGVKGDMGPTGPEGPQGPMGPGGYQFFYNVPGSQLVNYDDDTLTRGTWLLPVYQFCEARGFFGGFATGQGAPNTRTIVCFKGN